MALLVGIDEAGYGPLLGPLVVSAVSIRIADKLASRDLWQVLAASVTRSARSARGRLVIADSKAVFSRRQGLRALERTVLSALAAAGSRPGTVQQLLDLLDPGSVARLRAYPWHHGMSDVRLPLTKTEYDLAGSVLARDLAGKGISIQAIAIRCIDVALYNELAGRLKNKATLLFCQTCGLIQQVVDSYSDEVIVCLVDRQGGRAHYRAALQTMFPDLAMTVGCEDRTSSCYELGCRGRRILIRFMVDADALHLPVALASMVSKYVREVLMWQMNQYFCSIDPGICPTSGYWQDGQRFLQELGKAAGIDLDPRILVRSR